MRNGEEVLLCWRRGETAISYWHTYGMGRRPGNRFKGRVLLSLTRRAQNQRKVVLPPDVSPLTDGDHRLVVSPVAAWSWLRRSCQGILFALSGRWSGSCWR